MKNIPILNLPGPVLKAGSRWYNTVNSDALIRYYPYPWFMGYLSSLLKVNNFDVDFKDAVAMQWSNEKSKSYVESINPKYLICEPTWVSSVTDQVFLSSLDPNIIKIAVGNFATNFPDRCLNVGVDYVVIGEYEFSILEFLKSESKYLPVNFFSQSKKEYRFPELVNDLDIFPFPDRDGTPIRFFNEPSSFGVNVIMVSSRGCRLRCEFCNVESLYGKHSYRMRSAKNVVDEMEYLKNHYQFDEVYFDDDNMAANKKHLIEICQEIVTRKINIPWLCMGDGLIDDETLDWLAKAGCRTYKFGLEHFDPAVLQAIPKPLRPERMKAIIAKCKALGMRVYVNLIVGLPQSTREKDMAMIREVISLRPNMLQFGIATPYPGTVFNRKAHENGWLNVEDVTKYDVTGGSVVSYPDYSADEINEVYFQGKQMWYRHVLLHQPATALFYIRSELKREGVIMSIKKFVKYLLRALQS